MNGRPKSETKVEDNGESEEASAGIESDGRRKEIADETNRLAVSDVARHTTANDGGKLNYDLISTAKLRFFLFIKLFFLNILI